jgi:hypothetical protein
MSLPMPPSYHDYLTSLMAEHPELKDQRLKVIRALKTRFGISLVEAREVVNRFRSGDDLVEASSPEDILAVLQRETARRRVSGRRAKWIIGSTFAVIAVIEVVTSVHVGHFDGNLFSSMSGMGGIVAGASGVQKLAVRAAAELQDKRCLGPLLEILDAGDPKIKEIALEAIQRILPDLTAEDASLLDDKQLVCLYRLLHSTKKTKLTMAIISALRTMGGLGAVAELESAANGRVAVPKLERDRVTTMARMAVGDLRMRLAKNVIVARSQAVDAHVEAAKLEIGLSS